jgi:MFS family permease
VAGALADVVDRRRLLLGTQGWRLTAAVLGLLTLVGATTPWTLLALTFLLGLGTAMNTPAWQAITPDLVSRPELPALGAFAAGLVQQFADTPLPAIGVMAFLTTSRHGAPVLDNRSQSALQKGISHAEALRQH